MDQSKKMYDRLIKILIVILLTLKILKNKNDIK